MRGEICNRIYRYAKANKYMKCRDVTKSWLDDKLPLAG